MRTRSFILSLLSNSQKLWDVLFSTMPLFSSYQSEWFFCSLEWIYRNRNSTYRFRADSCAFSADRADILLVNVTFNIIITLQMCGCVFFYCAHAICVCVCACMFLCCRWCIISTNIEIVWPVIYRQWWHEIHFR